MEKKINDRIEKEYQRISPLFSDMAENQRTMIEPLLRNACFMCVTLEELREIIARDGAVERYQNGANQSGMKQSSALQSYNATMKIYSDLMRKLSDMIPVRRVLYNPKPNNEPDEEEISETDTEELERIKELDFQIAAEYQRCQREENYMGSFIEFRGKWYSEHGEVNIAD